jgi:hypothetical protein
MCIDPSCSMNYEDFEASLSNDLVSFTTLNFMAKQDAIEKVILCDISLQLVQDHFYGVMTLLFSLLILSATSFRRFGLL